VADARAAVLEAFGALAAIPDHTLTRPWSWRGQDADVRYGFYRLYEVMEEAAVGAALALERAGVRRAEAGHILAQATAARWDLHGLMLPITTADIWREPSGGEWPVLRALEHVISAQFSYTFRAAYAVHRVRSGRHDLPLVAPEEMALPVLGGMASGGALAEVHRRLSESRDVAREARALLDGALDTGIGLLQFVDAPPEMDAPTTWSKYDVTARFRLHRWASHLREHTLHVEKILALLGRVPSEAERLTRLVLGAYGRLEGLALGISESAVPAGAFLRAAEALRTDAREIRAAAGA
jgi:hypothetical protein